MSADIERHTGPAAPSDALVHQWEKTAAVLARSSMVPERYQNKPGDILAVAFTAHALGLDLNPYVLQRFYVPKAGTVAMDAQLHSRQADQHGWELWFDAGNDDKQATVYLQKRGTTRVHTNTFSIDDARRAGLVGAEKVSPAWKGYPKVMLAYRATTQIIRRVCPWVLMGVPNLDAGSDPGPPAAPDITAAEAKTRLLAAVVDAGYSRDRAIAVARDAWTAVGWGSDPVDGDALAQLIADTVANLPTGETVPGTGTVIDAEVVSEETDAGSVPAPAAPVDPARDAIRRRVFARCHEVGLDDTTPQLEAARRAVLAYATKGRARSTNDLGDDDVASVICALNDYDSKTLEIVVAPDGTLTAEPVF